MNSFYCFSINAEGFRENIFKAFLKSEFTNFWLANEVEYASKLIKFLGILNSYKRKENRMAVLLFCKDNGYFEGGKIAIWASWSIFN